MNDHEIRIHPTQIDPGLREKPPPKDNSDAWLCTIGNPPDTIDIYLYNRAKQAILRHAYEAPGREVGGVLVGGMYMHRHPKQAKPYLFIEITDAVPGDFTRGSSTTLTFTPDTWSQILSDIAARFPEKRIVGWYHTHPGHGVFLSEPDKFIQNNFFSHSRQLALVVDHVNRRAAFFTGSDKDVNGIQKSDDFTWDDALYQPRVQRPEMSKDAAIQRGSTQLRLTTGVQSASIQTTSSASHGKLRRRLRCQWWPWSQRKESRSLVASEQAEMLRINPADIDSPEVQHVIEEQEKARRRAEVYFGRYPEATVSPDMLYDPGCVIVVAAATVLLTVLLLALLLAGFFTSRLGVPWSPSSFRPTPNLANVVPFAIFALTIGLVLALLRGSHSS